MTLCFVIYGVPKLVDGRHPIVLLLAANLNLLEAYFNIVWLLFIRVNSLFISFKVKVGISTWSVGLLNLEQEKVDLL